MVYQQKQVNKKKTISTRSHKKYLYFSEGKLQLIHLADVFPYFYREDNLGESLTCSPFLKGLYSQRKGLTHGEQFSSLTTDPIDKGGKITSDSCLPCKCLIPLSTAVFSERDYFSSPFSNLSYS